MLKEKDFKRDNWERVTWQIVSGTVVEGFVVCNKVPPSDFLEWVAEALSIKHAGIIQIENMEVDKKGGRRWKFMIKQIPPNGPGEENK